jgi:membrane protease YdiL (CAAX protease family)
MSTQEIISTNRLQELSITKEKAQYTFWQILGIWLAAGAPMWALGWLAYPAMSVGLADVDAALLRVKLMTVGLIWQFVLSMLIVYREEGNLQLSTISRRFWLNHPVDAKTGETKKSLWWWLIVLIPLTAAVGLGSRPVLVKSWSIAFPLLAEPKGYDGSALFSPELRSQWVGSWGLFGLFFVFGLFNTVLGEEFAFRGVLLPRMKGVFGKWDWVANGLIFGLYHLHQPWGILNSVIGGWFFAFSAKRFHSSWFSIILHSGETVLLLVMILGVVLGLA